MSTLAKYFALLGVTPQSSEEEIKKAYRKKAKELHPDVSAHPDAEDRFKILNEAYEIILALKDRKREALFQKVQRPSYQPQTSQEKVKQQYDKNKAYREERMRQKRAEFEELQASDFYQFISSLDVLFKLVRVSFPFWVSAVGGVFGFVRYGFKGLIVVLIFCAPLWIVLYAYKDAFIGKQIVSAFNQLIRTKYFIKIFTVIAAGLMTFYPWHTVFELKWYFISFTLLTAASLPFLKFLKKKELSLRFILIGGIPFLIHFFFFLNYQFSSKPITEKYQYDIYLRNSSEHLSENVEEVTTFRETGQIFLPNRAYENAFWIRHFFNENAVMQGLGIVSFQFETGLFGLKVLKDYSFGPQH